MGREYGQGSRLFLNHDTVLIAEIITALSEEPEWGAAIRSRNCFHLPRPAETSPPALRYAAAATVLLAGAKVQDHATDSGQLRWTLLARWLDQSYRRAAAELGRWGVPVPEIERQLASQSRREAAPESLEQLAEPTCFATAQICRHAAPMAARAELAPVLEHFGHRFGYLVYLLDAWEDFERDAARGDFNAFRALYGKRDLARYQVTTAAEAVVSSFHELPVSSGFRDGLLMRFRINFATRIASLAIAGLPIMTGPVNPASGPFGPPRPGAKNTSSCSSGDDGSCCDGCFDSCCDGCSSCDCS